MKCARCGSPSCPGRFDEPDRPSGCWVARGYSQVEIDAIAFRRPGGWVQVADVQQALIQQQALQQQHAAGLFGSWPPR